MIIPRGKQDLARYGRHKVVAALVTFAVAWIVVQWVAPGIRDALEGIALRTPDHCFRERRSGDIVQTRILVEEALPDSTTADGTTLRAWKVRSLGGHPFVVLDREPSLDPAAPTDTLRVRGLYDWNSRGGTVRVDGNGWIHRH